jgi:hypothetical protein
MPWFPRNPHRHNGRPHLAVRRRRDSNASIRGSNQRSRATTVLWCGTTVRRLRPIPIVNPVLECRTCRASIRHSLPAAPNLAASTRGHGETISPSRTISVRSHAASAGFRVRRALNHSPSRPRRIRAPPIAVSSDREATSLDRPRRRQPCPAERRAPNRVHPHRRRRVPRNGAVRRRAPRHLTAAVAARPVREEEAGKIKSKGKRHKSEQARARFLPSALCFCLVP